MITMINIKAILNAAEKSNLEIYSENQITGENVITTYRIDAS